MEPQVISIAGINPTPWKAPEVGIGRKGGKAFPTVYKSAELVMYQESVRDELQTLHEKSPLPYYDGDDIEITFYLWRRIDSYVNEATGRRVTKHKADATNLQKSLEDACQGILFKNDNQVQSITTHIIRQDKEVEPYIQIRIGPHNPIVKLGEM